MKLREAPTPFERELRVEVRFTDVAGASAAALSKLPPEQIRFVEADALGNTQSVRSCVPGPLLEELGIRPCEQCVVEYADGCCLGYRM